MDQFNTCSWADGHPLLKQYHDTEWGVPVHDDRLLFEMLTLEGAQAGLSWLTILKKREAYRQAFAGFCVNKVAAFTSEQKIALLGNAGIVRNRLKVDSVIGNANALMTVQREHGSFDQFLWGLIGGRTLQGGHYLTKSKESDFVSRELRKRGFRFVGSTICYAFMQAVGMVNDHASSCPKRVIFARN